MQVSPELYGTQSRTLWDSQRKKSSTEPQQPFVPHGRQQLPTALQPQLLAWKKRNGACSSKAIPSIPSHPCEVLIQTLQLVEAAQASYSKQATRMNNST